MLFGRLVRAVVEFHIPAHVIEARQQFPAHTFLHLLNFLIREHAAEDLLLIAVRSWPSTRIR